MNLKQAKRNTRKIAKKLNDQKQVADELLKQRALKALLPIAHGHTVAVKAFVKNGGNFDLPPLVPHELDVVKEYHGR